jgi:hypothetical protein
MSTCPSTRIPRLSGTALASDELDLDRGGGLASGHGIHYLPGRSWLAWRERPPSRHCSNCSPR